MAGQEEPGTSGVGARRDSFEALRFLVGSIAGAAALIYIVGGLVLGLRLLSEGLPGLGIVGQLPREFLFSLGISEVVAPAVLIGVFVGLGELGERSRVKMLKGHLSWTDGVWSDEFARRTYLCFYATAPAFLLAPAGVVAIVQDSDIADEVVIAVGVIALAALAIWLRALGRWNYERAIGPARPPRTEESRALSGREWLGVLSGGVALLVGSLVDLAITHEWRYAAVPAAWFTTLPVVVLVVWIRGQIGARLRGRPDQPVTGLVVASFGATAILVLPSLVAVAAVRPLEDGVVCSRAGDLGGVFIGETKERAYIGTDDDRMISIPTSKIDRVVIGEDVTIAAC